MVAFGNVTTVELSWKDPYSVLDEHIKIKVFLSTYIWLVNLIGSYFHGILIFYERNAGDPLKRGLLNQVGIFAFTVLDDLQSLIIFS